VFLKDQGCLLRKELTGENHNLLVFFLKDNGLQMVLSRRPYKTSTLLNDPDLFESGELNIEKKGDNKPAFLKEFVPNSRYQGIARKYKALQAASRLTRFYEKNLIHMEFFDAAWELLHTALDSFSSKEQSDTILLKSLYVFARSEGYPVKENWLEKLSLQNKCEISSIIHSPVDSIDIDPDKITAWIRNLEIFFQQHTDLLVPD
jgi:hypothetical protein